MIYTVTLNPTLDITYVVEEVSFREPLRALEVHESPGGKGVNVSLALKALGVDSVAIGLVGGFTGREVRYLLERRGLDLRLIEIGNETRTNVVVLGRGDGRELVIRAAGPEVSGEEEKGVLELILDVARPPGFLVLSGSLPPGMGDGTYASLVTEGRRRGLKAVLDSDGEPMRRGIAAGPYLIKPNREELERLAGRPLAGVDEVASFARRLLSRGIEVVAVSLGREGALMVAGEGSWLGRVPVVEREDTVGAGDSMVAGLLAGLSGSLPLEEAFRMGLAAGASAVSNPGPALCEAASFEECMRSVELFPL